MYHKGKTAFNLWKQNKLITYQSKNIPTQRPIWFLFGEVDCRIHIYHKHKTTLLDESFLIRRTVESYLDYLDTFDREIWVLDCPPTGVGGNRFGYEYYADYETRKKYTIEFNRVLKILIGTYQWKLRHLPYFDQCVDDNLDRKKEFVKDDTHLNDKMEDACFENFNRIGRENE